MELTPALTPIATAGKGGKFGAALGDAFAIWRQSVGLTREGFHSFRHGVAEALERAGVSETDAARALGHEIPALSYGVYSSGPGVKRLAAVVEEIAYPGLAASAGPITKRPATVASLGCPG
jgi:integrase